MNIDTKTTKPATTDRQPTPAGAHAVTAHAASPLAEMESFFDRLSEGLLARMGFPALAGPAGHWPAQAPRVDLVDRGKELVLRAEVPGVSKEDLKVTLQDGVLSIRGETRRETRADEGDYHRREISRGSFERTVALPADVAADKVKASFRDGVLELVMPKNGKPSGRTIPIE
jgi:HSP20 family protein